MGHGLWLFFTMFPVAEPADLTADARWPDVRLQDAYEFGVTYKEAHYAWSEAHAYVRHYDDHMKTWYFPGSYNLWLKEADWAKRVWDKMDNSLNENQPRHWRLEELTQLRAALGEEAYNARRLPNCVPDWLFARR